MSKYTQEDYNFPTSLDEIGLSLGLKRLPKESMDNYRRRLLLQSKAPPNPTRDSIISTPQRKVGLFDKKVMTAALVLDSDDRPIAKDPRIEINASYIKVWENWNEGANDPDLELNISLRSGKYFLRDVYDELSKLSFITITKSTSFEDYLKSFNLKIGNTDKVSDSKLLTTSKLNKIGIENLRSCIFSDYRVYSNEVDSLSNLIQDGDYYIDYYFGYIYSFLAGRGNVTIEYRNFPFVFYWQPVKVFEVNDSTTKEFTRDLIVNDNGVSERLLLNSYGAKIANIILKEHPLQWGK